MVSTSDLLLCAPTIEAQLVLLLCHAFFWNQWIVSSSKNIFEPWSMFPTAICLLATLQPCSRDIYHYAEILNL